MTEEKARGSWLKTIVKALRSTLSAILQGELLLRLKIGHYFLHIAFCFAVVALTIWVSLLIDNTLTRVENGHKAVEAQKNEIAVKEYRLVELTRRSTVEANLQELGSKVKEPRHPAFMIGGKSLKNAKPEKNLSSAEKKAKRISQNSAKDNVEAQSKKSSLESKAQSAQKSSGPNKENRR